MKRLLFVLAITWAIALQAASPTITVTVSDFTLDYSAASRVVRLTPKTGGSAARAVSDSDGLATFSSVTPADYTLTIENVGVPALTLRVPSSTNTLAASALVISQFTFPTRTAGTITPENIVASGYLTLSGQTNQVSDDGTQLLFNGSPVMVWTNEAGWTHLATTTNRIGIGSSDDPGHRFRVIAGANNGSVADTIALSASNGSDLSTAQKPVFNYGSGTAYAISADSSNTNSTGANVALYGSSGGQAKWNIGAAGVVYGTTAGATNSGIYGAAATYGTAAIFNAIVGELVNDESAVAELIQETSVLLLDNRDTAAPLIIARDNGVTKFNVTTNGLANAAGGFAKGNFTGITTTNTVYTTGAGGSGSVTNLIVVQGGIITGWTVTQ